ncbi:hypothetical protein CHS0354_031091 [Potamilus streckersoni]|uniref:Gamma-butyrobetaine dioxygenase n=1 Tax=Potamilus streckersoni TaxID=2493646 RepID=A0AAE0RZQ4_9BIVA|nr:hypothetical protein CHS0354_031091 [Potamilus streckersoni]
MLSTMTTSTYRRLALCVQRAKYFHRVMEVKVRPLFNFDTYGHNSFIQRWQEATPQINGIRFYSMPIKLASAREKQVVSADVENNGRQLVITWKDGVKSRYHSLWLRVSCQCSKCLQAASNMKLIRVEELDRQTVLEKASVSDDGLAMSLTWRPGSHMGTIGLDYLRVNRYDPDALATRHHLTTPLFLEEGDPIPEVNYEEVNASEKGMYKWLRYIDDYGICMMRNVPTEKLAILQVVEKIAPAQKTIYGTVFDVVQESIPSNFAYSTVELPLHMDLTYYDTTPGLQFLHCLRFDDTVKGGDSTFVDLFRVAEDFRKQYPTEFEVLTRVPVIFARIHSAREHPVYMITERKHIEVNGIGEIVRINWHPGTQSSMAVPEKDLDGFFDAYLIFAKMIQTSPSYRTLRLKPGDMIGFNNRRMGHGRTAYEETAAGNRHLQGCYINIDEFKSMVQVLSLTVGDGSLARRVFNGSSF